MRIEWKRVAMMAVCTALFAGLALDLTVPLAALCALAAVDRTLVSFFITDISETAEEQAA